MEILNACFKEQSRKLVKNHPDKTSSLLQKHNSERFNLLRLARTSSVGPITFGKLLKNFGSATKVIEYSNDHPELKSLFKNNPLATPSKIEQEIALTERHGGKIVFVTEANYPKLLRFIPDPPPVITILGRFDLLNQPAIAIVGARHASTAGKKIAELFSSELGKEGFVIVSGMARGIDKSAHQAALEHGTIAVIAGGVDHIYPQENADLYHQIKEHGVIMSEQPWGIVPQAGFFPRRNRIISGLSLGVLVVEAGEKSGSLITAKCALDQGREVFAVPGSPLDSRSYGANNLIRQGAVLTQGIQDIIECLPEIIKNPKTTTDVNKPQFTKHPHQKIDYSKLADQRNISQFILEKLSPIPILVDELANECQLSLADLRVMLIELEVAGKVQRHLGDKISLAL